MTLRSLYDNQDELLSAILTLHLPEGIECDVCYGNGGFYRSGAIAEPQRRFDIDPQIDGIVKADSGDLPLEPSSIRSLIFDPPFLTYVKNGRDHKNGAVAMSARFGGYWSYSDLRRHYMRSIAEAERVLIPDGHLVVKCQDIIHNHRLHATSHNVIRWAEPMGLRLKDVFVLAAKHRMPGPQKGTQRHARVWHSYFLVFQKQKTATL